MKKTVLKLVALLLLVLFVALALAACGGTVKFKLNFIVDGKVYDTVDTAGQEAVALPENPTKEGDEFDGWYWDQGEWNKPFTANSLLDAPLSSDMNVYAKWKSDAKKLPEATTGNSDPVVIVVPGDDKVQFHLNFIVDGAVFGTVDTAGNAVVSLPQNPVKEGYIFDGWFWDNGTWERPFTANSLLNAPLSSDMSVYAKFSLQIRQFTGLSFAEAEFVYDGEPKSLALVGAPEGATVEYSGNGQTEIGTYTVTATVSMEGYETATLTAMLKITNDPSAANLVNATGFTVDGNALSMVFPNATESYSFLGQITVSPKATWQISTDIYGVNCIPTKTVPLNLGDNTFYLLIVSENGEGISLYTVTIRRRPIWTLTFDPNGGTAVGEQAVEEDGFATAPTTTRTGYTIAGWDYDFTQPVKGDATVTASWTPNTDTAYTVEYYLQNASATGYDLTETATERLTGTTASSVAAEIKVFPHFTYAPDESTASGTVAPDGSLVLKLYYTRDTYTVTFVGNGGTLTNGMATQTVRYENAATLPTFVRNGYSFTGWDDVSGCDSVAEDLTVTAQWETITYTVTYDLTGGTLDGSNPTSYTVEDDVALREPTREYYHFLGWYDAGGTQITNLLGHYGDLTLTARWECYFTLNNSGAITGVSRYCKQNVTDLVIPASLNGTTIKSISANTFTNCISLTSITIPDSVTSIGAGAFSGCSALESITIPFVGGSKKTASNTYQYPFGYIFGTGSYTGGTATTQYYYGSSTSSTTNTTYYIPSSLQSVTVTGGNILRGAFYNCSGLTSVTIPDGVTSIGNDAFYNCSGLTDVSIPTVAISSIPKTNLRSVVITSGTSIPGSAFANCTNLISISIPDSVTSIGGSAFSGCSGLTSVTIPDSVTSIGEGAFSGCSSLESITIPFVGAQAGKTASDTYQYPFGYIFGTGSYTGGTATTQYYYGSSTSSTTNTTYYIPSSLQSVTVTGGNILRGAFYKCSGLTSVTIGDGVTSIGDYAFYYCSGLTSVTIGDGVTGIGNSAFFGCSALQSITIPFVGGSRKTASDTYQYPFGYIFGTSSYTGGVETAQYYYGSSTSSTTSTTFYIPSSLKSVTVTGGNILRGAFYGCSGLTSVTIPDSVTSIGYRAFEDCSGLTSITIPNSVTSIDSSAFSGCSGLTSVIIPDGVTSIGNSAFYNCSGLTEVVWNASNCISAGSSSYPIFSGCSELTSVTIGDGVTSIGGSAFYNCTRLTGVYYTGDIAGWCGIAFASYDANPLYYAHNLYINGALVTDLVIPDSVTSIRSYAFYGCAGLTSVTIGNGVTSIGEQAFLGCSGLTSVTLPDSVTSIGGSAFYNCTGLTSVTIPNSVTYIGSYAFFGCSGLKSVTIPNSVTSIGNRAFYNCSGLTSITIPESVTSIGEWAFYKCSGLTSVTIPDSVTSIGNYAFQNCSGLTSIVWNATNCTSAGSIFSGCSKLTTVTFGDNVKTIPAYAFYGCAGLKSVTIPESVTSIGEWAFYKCYNLTSVTIGNSVTSIGDSAFEHCTRLKSVTIPDSVTSIGAGAFRGCSWLTSITVSNGNTKYHSSGNCIIETASKTLILGCEKSVIPTDGSVTSVGGSAFYNCTGLTSVTIPNSVTYIGSYAFFGCSGLKSVTIPNSVTSIGEYVFYNCSGLTAITIPDSVKSIGNSAFYNCSGLTSVTIGNGVTSIGDYAFDNCSRLTEIHYQGTGAQWNAISKGSNWNSNTGNYTVYCTDGTISK